MVSTSSHAAGSKLPAIIIAGASGQVGSAMVRQLRTAGRRVFPVTRSEVDLSQEPAAVARDFSRFLDANPSSTPVFINAAAWTAVDAAENPANALAVRRINAESPGALAIVCQQRRIPHIFVSTDYVFGGDQEASNDPEVPKGMGTSTAAHPVNNYGRTKYAGEQAVLATDGTVVRTAWVFSGVTGPGRDFVDTMRGLAQRGIDPAVVADQFGRPTFAGHLAQGLVELADGLASEKNRGKLPTLLHATGGGELTTWYGFACTIFSETGHDPTRVSAIPTTEYPTPAARPVAAYLDTSGWTSAGLTALPAWQDGLKEALG